jgi:hypothetical protein
MRGGNRGNRRPRHILTLFCVSPGKFLLRCGRMPSRTNLPNIYIISPRLTLMVQHLFKEKPFLVLRCTSKKR